MVVSRYRMVYSNPQEDAKKVFPGYYGFKVRQESLASLAPFTTLNHEILWEAILDTNRVEDPIYQK